MSFETIDEWSSFISEQHEYHEEGDRPQLGRICPQSPGADPVRDPCVPTMESVADLCERRDSRCIVRAISGNAVLFYNHAHDGSLSARFRKRSWASNTLIHSLFQPLALTLTSNAPHWPLTQQSQTVVNVGILWFTLVKNSLQTHRSKLSENLVLRARNVPSGRPRKNEHRAETRPFVACHCHILAHRNTKDWTYNWRRAGKPPLGKRTQSFLTDNSDRRSCPNHEHSS